VTRFPTDFSRLIRLFSTGRQVTMSPGVSRHHGASQTFRSPRRILMIRKIVMLSTLLALATVSAAVLVGCSESGKNTPASVNSDTTPSTQTAAKKAGSEAEGEHAHKPGEHGGIIVEIGRDNYHAEAVFEKGGVLRLYTLGKE